MSHVVSIDVEFNDLASLMAACKRLGWAFLEGVSYKWWGTDHGRSVGDYPLPEGYTESEIATSLHSIRVPGTRYSVGVFASKSGRGYDVLWDFFDYELKMAMGGEGGGRLAQAYGLEKAKKEMRLRGRHLVKEETRADGTVKLVFAG
jgi:hypothetical protein